MKTQIDTINRPRSAEDGFTLMEILIALVVFSVGILGVAGMQITASSSSTTAGVVSANVAQSVDRVEKLLSMAWDYDNPLLAPNTTISPDPEADFIDNDEDGQVDELGETGHVSITWDVLETVPKAGSDTYSYKTVTVTITRQTPKGPKSMILVRNIPNIVGD